jgi:hypothetical protein
MSGKILKIFLVSLVCALVTAGCAIKRPAVDFKQLGELENQNSTPVYTDSQSQLEFPISPGASADSGERVESKRPGITLVLGGAGVASFATVGILKRLKKEGVKVDLIVASGWPALFSLGYGFLKSVHDLEWFAMRLQDADFSKACKLGDSDDQGEVSKLIESFFKKADLRETRIPLVIVSDNTEREQEGAFDSGDWRKPLVKTMAMPGLYRPFPKESSSAKTAFDLQALAITEAKKRSHSLIFAVEMYSDYLEFFKVAKEDVKKPTIRSIYLASLRKSIREEQKQASGAFSVELHSSPLDYSKKRAAILAGSTVAGSIIKKLVN